MEMMYTLPVKLPLAAHFGKMGYCSPWEIIAALHWGLTRFVWPLMAAMSMWAEDMEMKQHTGKTALLPVW